MYEVWARETSRYIPSTKPFVLEYFDTLREAEEYAEKKRKHFANYNFWVVGCITEEQAREFWRDLMGTLWHDPDTKATHGIMGVELIADYMNISIGKAVDFLRRCAHDDLKFTKRKGDGWIV